MFDDRKDLRGRIQLNHAYKNIISVENLLEAWKEFLPDKRKKVDVQEFQSALMDHIFQLHRELENRTWRHGHYEAFKISDPKPRDIHKATVRDRLMHHALYRVLYPFFDRTWIPDSYSCRLNKGTHRAMDRFQNYARKVSKNNTRTCWVLKCDIRKFFASIDHAILLELLAAYIPEKETLDLLRGVIGSFYSTAPGKGLPLGNLTSQMLVNVYMNEFDQFAKHSLKATHYLRYADDFVIMHENKKTLEELLPRMESFLRDQLKLSLHPDKVSIKTYASGIDFLGWIHFPNHRVLRTSSKRRMIRNLEQHRSRARVESYRGLLSHGNANKLRNTHL